MGAFEPRRAAPGAALRWLREAGELLLRRPLAWTGTGLAIGLVPALVGDAVASGAISRVPGTLLVVLCADAWFALACGLGLHVAILADEGEGVGALPARLGAAWRALATPVWLSFLVWGLVYAVLVAVGASASPAILERLAGAETAPGQRAATLLGALNLGLAPVGGWFLTALLACAHAPLAEALELSQRAARLNARALWPLALGAAVLWTGFAWWAIGAFAPFGLGLALGLALVPLSALLWVSYREVFLGRGKNAPARSPARVAAGAVGRV